MERAKKIKQAFSGDDLPIVREISAPVGKAARRAKTAMKACIFMSVVKFRRPHVVLGGVNLRILFIRRHPRFSHFRIRAAHGHACSVALSRLIKGLKTL